MAENNNNLGKTISEATANVNLGNLISNLDEKPLMKSFLKYFTDTPANIMRSVEFGKSIFRYFAPDVEMPNDPAALLNATRTLFTTGFADNKLTDEVFVRFMLDKIDKEPDLVTFDMVADLVESKAYKKFGQNEQDKIKKQKFEQWICNDSILSKIDLCSEVDVALNKDGLDRVIKTLQPSKADEYRKSINNKVLQFDELYAKQVESLESFQDLKKNARTTSNRDFATQLKGVYGILCGPEKAEIISNVIDSAYMSAPDAKVRNDILTGYGINANKTLLALCRRKNWPDKAFEKMQLKFPIEKRAEKFEEQAQQIADQEGNKTQNNEAKKLNPVLDVARTFGMTLTGAAVISTITSIPGVGQVVGPLLGIGMVARAGIGTALSNYNAAKKYGNVTKEEALQIARKSGIAMAKRAIPYAAATAFGPLGRVVGAGIMVAKTLYADLERRAGLQRTELQRANEAEQAAEAPKGLKAKLKHFAGRVKASVQGELRHIADIAHKTKGSDFAKSFAYALAKGGAVLAGGTIGSEIGSSIGSNLFEVSNGEATFKPNAKKMVEDLEQTKYTGKLIGAFKGLNGQEVDQSIPLDVHPASVEDDIDVTEDMEYLNSTAADNGMTQTAGVGHSGNVQLSEDNLERLGEIGEVKLTEHARMTVHADNNRQYVGGEQQNWYNTAQEETALQTLRDAGVEDPAGVLRKAGSMARFFGGKYQTTLDNLCAGNVTDNDVDNIFDALKQINEEGGLGQIAKQPTYQTHKPVHEPVTTTTEVPSHTQEYRTPASEVTEDLSASRFVPDEITADPIDVPPHTQEYRTPNTVKVAETYEAQETSYSDVDIDNSIDYREEDNQFTNTDVPPHTQEYRVPTEGLSELSSVELPSHTHDYIVPNDTMENDFTAVSADEPAMLSDDQLARLRASWVRSNDLAPSADFMTSMNDEELHSMMNYLSEDELNVLNENMSQASKSVPTNLPNTDLDPERFNAKYYDNLTNSLKTEIEMKYPESTHSVNNQQSWKNVAPGSPEMKPLEDAMINNGMKVFGEEMPEPSWNWTNIDNYEMSGNYENGYNYTNSGMTDRSSVLSAIREHNQSLNDEPTMER